MADQQKFGDPTQIRHTIGVEGAFSLHNVAGDIRLRGTDTDEVLVHARSSHGRSDSLPLIVRRTDGGLRIEVEQGSFDLLGLSRRRVGIEFDVTLPRAARVEVNAVSSDIESHGLSADQAYKTVSGDVTVEGHGGRVSLTTVSGDVELTADQQLEPSVATTSGDISISAPSVTALQVRTVSGDTRIRSGFLPDAGHRVESVSGDLLVQARSGLTLDVRRGIDVASGRNRRMVAGDGSAELRFRSLSGDVHLEGDVVEPAPAPAAPVPGASDESLRVLRALERGEIDVEEAARRLEGASSHG